MKKNKNIKLIVCDLDGTLLNSKASVSYNNSLALHKLNDLGIKIAFCSGRQAADIEHIACSIGLNDAIIISLNGSFVMQKSGEIAINEKIPKDSAKKCLNIFNKYDVVFSCFCGNVLINNKVPEYEKDVSFWNEDRRKRRKLVTHLYGDNYINKYMQEGFNKFVYVDLENQNLLQKIKNEMSYIQGIEITSSWQSNFEIMPKGINKGFALKKLINKLNIEKSNVLAFGDNDNDIELLKTAGYGVAMDNANDALKNIADFITLSNDNDGVAYFINQFVLESLKNV